MGIEEQDFELPSMRGVLRHTRGDVKWRSKERSG